MSFFDFDDNPDYEETRQLKLGEATLPPWREKLRLQFSKRFKIPFINVVYERLRPGTPTELPRLNAIVESQEDWMRIRKDRFTIKYHVRKSMIKQLTQIVEEFELEQQIKLEKLFVISECFEAENIAHQVVEFFERDRDELLNHFSAAGVWGIEGPLGRFPPIVVFFKDESTKRSALESALADEIQQSCYDRVKQYDEFGYLTPENFKFRFDTKEYLDERCRGNLYYYFH